MADAAMQGPRTQHGDTPSRRHIGTRPLQRKLTIGASNDPLEQEADRIANQVMTMSPNGGVSSTPLRIQRAAGQATTDAGTAPTSLNRVLAGSGRPLDPASQQDMSQRFGHGFSQVHVHTGTAAKRSTLDVNVHAYAVGQNIVSTAGQFAPGMCVSSVSNCMERVTCGSDAPG
jgi:Domain of unknown function (DUF4157)